MQGTTFYIKNMVCNRCIMAVEQLLGRLHFTVLHVELGKAVVGEVPDEASVEQLRRELEALGFELLDDRRMQLIEQVRHLVIDLVHHKNSALRTNLSDYLTEHLHHDYSALSKLFSEVTGTTIEKYFIAQKIERVKELLVYDELSIHVDSLIRGCCNLCPCYCVEKRPVSEIMEYEGRIEILTFYHT